MTTTAYHKLLLLLICTFGWFGIGIVSAQAQSLTVDFEAEPLFLDADVKPGDSTTRTVTVTNGANEGDEVRVSIQNAFDAGLASAMRLRIQADGTTYFDDTFTVFFSLSDPYIELGSIGANSTRVYEFIASIPTTAGNEYQTTQLGFDLVIGFASGQTFTDTPGGSGGGGGSVQLTVFNEAVSTLGDSATVTWNTNLPATSYLLCGDVEFGPFSLTTAAPLFGYQFVVPENPTLTTTHEMIQTGLAAGTYECRPASRLSETGAFTIGRAVVFTIPEGIVAGEDISVPTEPTEPTATLVWQPQPTGSVLGAGKKGLLGAPTYDEWRAELERERAEREAREQAEATSTDQTDSATDAEMQTLGTQPLLEAGWFERNRLPLLLFLLFLILGGGWIYYVRRTL